MAWRLFFSFVLTIGALLHAAEVPSLPAAAQRKIDPSEVQTLFRTRCYGCHGAQQQMSGLRLDQSESAMRGGYSGPVIKPGGSAESTLVHRISAVKGVPRCLLQDQS
jgi:mono/diheme cytochrome c family protein